MRSKDGSTLRLTRLTWLTIAYVLAGVCLIVAQEEDSLTTAGDISMLEGDPASDTSTALPPNPGDATGEESTAAAAAAESEAAATTAAAAAAAEGETSESGEAQGVGGSSADTTGATGGADLAVSATQATTAAAPAAPATVVDVSTTSSDQEKSFEGSESNDTSDESPGVGQGIIDSTVGTSEVVGGTGHTIEALVTTVGGSKAGYEEITTGASSDKGEQSKSSSLLAEVTSTVEPIHVDGQTTTDGQGSTKLSEEPATTSSARKPKPDKTLNLWATWILKNLQEKKLEEICEGFIEIWKKERKTGPKKISNPCDSLKSDSQRRRRDANDETQFDFRRNGSDTCVAISEPNVTPDETLEFCQTIRKPVADKLGITVEKINIELRPAPQKDASKGSVKDGVPAPKQGGIWEEHYGLFLTVIIMLAVCLSISLICFISMRCRQGRAPSDKQRITLEEGSPYPIEASNPIPDAEIVRDEGPVPMQEVENQAVTPNGGGQHISKADEDNGWVVPLEELSKAEKEKPEIENTKL